MTSKGQGKDHHDNQRHGLGPYCHDWVRGTAILANHSIGNHVVAIERVAAEFADRIRKA